MEILQQCVNGLVQGSIYALIALGYTMVYGVLRLINFAHGDVYMLGAYIGYFASGRLASLSGSTEDGNFNFAGIAIIFLVSMLGSALIGIIIERFAYRPLRNSPRLTALITAIGVSMFIEYGAQALFGSKPRPFPKLISDNAVINTPDFTLSTMQITIVVVALILMVLLQFIVYQTKLGRAMRAVSLDRQAASLMGINTDVVIAFTFAIGSGLAAAAGILSSTYQNTINPLIGIAVGLKAFVAAVLGGIGSIPGAVLGGMLLGFAETAVAGSAYSQYRDAIAFAILIAVLIVKPAGLLGRTTAEKV
jgi:branched-chain amino acid transport system permease protein